MPNITVKRFGRQNDIGHYLYRVFVDGQPLLSQGEPVAYRAAAPELAVRMQGEVMAAMAAAPDNPVPEVNIPQLYLMRSLVNAGVPYDLMDKFLLRCGATEADWGALLKLGYAHLENGRYLLTKLGHREYKRQKVGKYF